MGGSDSKDQEKVEQTHIPIDPLITRLQKTLKFSISSNHKMTHSFIHSDFSQQINKKKDGKINQNFSPFCSLLLNDSKAHIYTIVTCVMISPIMALAPKKNIKNQQDFGKKKLTLFGLCKEERLKMQIKMAFDVKDSQVLVLILQKPVWEIGWSGISFIQNSSEIKELPLCCISNRFNTGETTIKDSQNLIQRQQVSKVYYQNIGYFKGKSAISGDQLVSQIIDRKTYVIGVQTGMECQFFSLSFVQELRQHTKHYLTPDKQKQILKQMNIEQIEIQSGW